VDALKRSPLFEGLSRRQLIRVARLSDDLEVPAGTVLCKEGSRGQEFFIIVDGEARARRDAEDLTTFGAGDFFGEIALLEPVKRTATVTATTPLRFFVISQQAFASVLSTDPQIERKVLRTVVRRLALLTGDPTVPNH
jgi:CRP/FNR family transcriptional regulator, cyclic AMP receptor protein